MLLSMIGKKLNIQYVLIFCLIYDEFCTFCTKLPKWKLMYANRNSCRKFENCDFIYWYVLFHAFIIECIQNSTCKYVTMM